MATHLLEGPASRGIWIGVGAYAALQIGLALLELAVAADAGTPSWTLPTSWSRSVLSLVSAYTLGAMLVSISATAADLASLRPQTALSEGEWQRLRRRLLPTLRRAVLAGLLGGAVGVLIVAAAVSTDPSVEISNRTMLLAVSADSLLNFVLFSLLGLLTAVTICHWRVFQRVGEQHLEVGLFQPQIQAPFARVGLRSAGIWFCGSALASLLFAGATSAAIAAMVILATVGIGCASLLVPTLGLRRQLRDRKQVELARVRAEIAEAAENLFAEGAEAIVSTRLPALIAYEARVAETREWPYDTPAVGRFALLLLIPLGSWIGGALVERAIDSALR